MGVISDTSNVVNSYPEKPVYSYQKTSTTAQEVANYIKTTSYSDAVKQAALAITANESGWGAKGINNNIAGIQADSRRWGASFDSYIIGTTVIAESRTGKKRRFACFNDWRRGVDMLLYKVNQRNLFIGGFPALFAGLFIDSVAKFVTAYFREWVVGSKTYKPSNGEISDTTNIYNYAGKLLGKSVTSSTGDEKKKYPLPNS